VKLWRREAKGSVYMFGRGFWYIRCRNNISGERMKLRTTDIINESRDNEVLN